MTLSWTQPCCERCWIDREGEQELVKTEPDGTALFKLLSLRMPTRLRNDAAEIEQCAFCGAPTFIGVYVRADPTTVAYPHEKD